MASQGGRTLIGALVVDIQKRHLPSKHYVYVMNATWSEGSVLVIYRRYSAFFEFHVKLLDMFPEAAGEVKGCERLIPFLPGKKLFERTNTRKHAVQRKQAIQDYVTALIKLPKNISACQHVKDFFSINEEDMAPPTAEELLQRPPNILEKAARLMKGDLDDEQDDKEVTVTQPMVLDQYRVLAAYKKTNRSEVDVRQGDIVEVVEKNTNGWWFINVDDAQGWVPATYLEPLESVDSEEGTTRCPQGLNHVSIQAYKTAQPDEIGFDKGVVVQVIETNLDGWWRVRYQGKEGWAPAACLAVAKGRSAEVTAEEVMQIMETANKATKPDAKALAPRGEGTQASSRATARTRDERGRLTASMLVTESIAQRAASMSGEAKPVRPTAAPRTDGDRVVPTRPAPPLADSDDFAGLTMGAPIAGLGAILAANTAAEKDMPKAVAKVKKETSLEEHVALEQYKNDDGSMQFDAGTTLVVVEKTDTGWWFVRLPGGREGWAPSDFLEKKTSSLPSTSISSARSGKTSPTGKLTSNVSAPTKESGVHSALKSSGTLKAGAIHPGIKAAPDVPGVNPVVAWSAPGESSSEETPGNSLRDLKKPGSVHAVKGFALPGMGDAKTISLSKAPSVEAIGTISLSKAPSVEAIGHDSDFAVKIVPAPLVVSTVFSPSSTPAVAALVPSTAKLVSVKPAELDTKHRGASEAPKSVTVSSPIVSSVARVISPVATKAELKPGNPVAQPKLIDEKPLVPESPVVTVVKPAPASAPTAVARPTLAPKPAGDSKSVMTRSSTMAGSAKATDGDEYVAEEAYTSPDADGLSFKQGESMIITEKSESGWYFARIGVKEGWVPSSFIIPSAKKSTLAKPTVATRSNESARTGRSDTMAVSGVNSTKLPSSSAQLPSTIVKTVTSPSAAPKNAIDLSASGGLKPAVLKSSGSIATAKPLASSKSATPLSETHVAAKPASTVKPAVAMRTATMSANKGLAGEEYVAQDSYTSVEADGLSFKQHDKMIVLEKSESGWYFALIDGKEGWVPSSFIAPIAKGGIEIPLTSSGSVTAGVAVASASMAKSGRQDMALDIKSALEKNIQASPTNSMLDSASVTTKPKSDFKATLEAKVQPDTDPKPKLSELTKEKPAIAKAKPRPAQRPVAGSAVVPGGAKYLAVDDYTREDESGLSLRKDEIIEIVEKNESGWWFARNTVNKAEGWVPSSFLALVNPDPAVKVVPAPRPIPAAKGKKPRYEAVDNYTAEDPTDGFNFKKGDSVEVVEKSETGWWFARMGATEGWIPSTFLKECV